MDTFEHISRFRDSNYDHMVVARIKPGEFYVTDKNEMITTVLGSCISVCAYDPGVKVGGMNHFMLPEGNTSDADKWEQSSSLAGSARYGNFAMEQMVNAILKLGGRRNKLLFKVFGGGGVIQSATNIGENNITFVRKYLRDEGFFVESEDVGDIYPRRVNFFPYTGKVMVKKIKNTQADNILVQEEQYRHKIDKKPVAGDIELF